MNLRIHPRLRNGYAVSFILHGLLCLLCALLFIKPMLPAKWHSFEWELPEPDPSPEAAAAMGVSSAPASEETPVVSASSDIVSPAQQTQPEPVRIDNPVIETPATPSSSARRTKIPNTRRGSGLRDLSSNLPGGDYGFSANLEQGSGEAYIISQPKPQIVPNEEGEVYLEFRLTPRGDVDMNSVVVLSFSNAKYQEAVQKAMRSWRFGFRGAYNSERKYRIRCNFVINEN